MNIPRLTPHQPIPRHPLVVACSMLLLSVVLTAFAPSTTEQALPGEKPTVAGMSVSTVFLDTFDQYTVEAVPAGWSQFGTTDITAIVRHVSGDNLALFFPEIPWNYTDKFVIKDGLTLSPPFQLQAQLTFGTDVADKAGLVFGWSGLGDTIRIMPNVYWDNLEVWQIANGQRVGGAGTAGGTLSVKANTPYWLRVDATTQPAPRFVVSWSTDGTTFREIYADTAVASLSGAVGMTTAGPHLPPAEFDNFKVSIDTPTCPAGQWQGAYYANRDLQGTPASTRCDRAIDFNWDLGAPAEALPIDNFSVRWQRTVNFPKAGLYRFRAFTDDGLNLSIDGEKIINDWTARTFQERSATKMLTAGSHQITMEYVEWSHAAMAYLNWYLCPNGAGDCGLNITPRFQTHYLRNPMPEACTGVANQTIARWGCLITSIAMALQSYGITTTPAELNTWLSQKHPVSGKQPRGYTEMCTANLLWDDVLAFAKSRNVHLKWQTTDDAANVIRTQHRPVIMQVAGGGHWVLATDVAEVDGVQTLGINDPHHAWSCQATPPSPALPPSSLLQCTPGPLRHATQLLEERTYRGSSVPSRYLAPATAQHSSSLQFGIQGAEILVTDVNGRRTGYHQATRQTFTEIPNSSYFDAEITPAGTEASGGIKRTLYLPEAPAGAYTVETTSPPTMGLASTNATFIVDVVGYDSDFTPVETAIVGSLPAGGEANYQLQYNPGRTITTKPQTERRVYLPSILR